MRWRWLHQSRFLLRSFRWRWRRSIPDSRVRWFAWRSRPHLENLFRRLLRNDHYGVRRVQSFLLWIRRVIIHGRLDERLPTWVLTGRRDLVESDPLVVNVLRRNSLLGRNLLPGIGERGGLVGLPVAHLRIEAEIVLGLKMQNALKERVARFYDQL
jgi:hypothetical protein